MHAVDYGIIVLYFIGLLYLGLRKRLKGDSTTGELILGGRMLTLPAFVASLVSTWYGGILGVGEYSYLYGLSNWLVFGLPYYLAAAVFAIFLARKARDSMVLTIPARKWRGQREIGPGCWSGPSFLSSMSSPEDSARSFVPICFSSA